MIFRISSGFDFKWKKTTTKKTVKESKTLTDFENEKRGFSAKMTDIKIVAKNKAAAMCRFVKIN